MRAGARFTVSPDWLLILDRMVAEGALNHPMARLHLVSHHLYVSVYYGIHLVEFNI